MKVFIYPDVYGAGGIRLAGDDVKAIARAEDADVLVVPECTFAIARKPAIWQRLWNEPEILRRPENVVVFDCSDSFDPPPLPGCLYFRCGLTTHQLAKYPSAISWAWPVPDLGWYAKQHDGVNRCTVSFVGWTTPRPETRLACHSVQEEFGVWSRIAIRDDFHGHRGLKAGTHAEGDAPPDTETVRREEEYRRAMYDSLLTLSPQSIDGVFRYRFFEAMTAGRVPVHVGSNYVLPWADRIPWDEIAVFIKAEDARDAGPQIRDWIEGKSEADVLEIGRRARQVWEQWIDKNKTPALMAAAVRERLFA